MAINNWANVTLDPSAALKTDRASHINTPTPGTADGGNFTSAWDSAVITRMTLYDSAAASARAIAASRLPP
jgi:hypothetical protein